MVYLWCCPCLTSLRPRRRGVYLGFFGHLFRVQTFKGPICSWVMVTFSFVRISVPGVRARLRGVIYVKVLSTVVFSLVSLFFSVSCVVAGFLNVC